MPDGPVLKEGFAPVIRRESRVLILGTFPGKASREKAEFYGNPRNSFWTVMFDILAGRGAASDYIEKIELLQSSKIALWDIVARCETEGSLDSEIKSEALIDLPGLLREYPEIRLVCFNGGNAARYAKRFGSLPSATVTLPSTSPANARMSYAEKRARWAGVILPALQDISAI